MNCHGCEAPPRTSVVWPWHASFPPDSPREKPALTASSKPKSHSGPRRGCEGSCRLGRPKKALHARPDRGAEGACSPACLAAGQCYSCSHDRRMAPAPQRLMLRSSRMRWGLRVYAVSPEPGFLGAPWCAPRRVLDAGLLRTESAARARSRSSPGTAEAPHPRGPFATAQSRLTHQRGRSLLHPGGTAWRASKQRWERVVKIHIILKNESNFLKSTLVRAAVQKGL